MKLTINSVDEARDVLRKHLAYQGSGLFNFMVEGGHLCVLKNAAGRREVRWVNRTQGSGLVVDSLAGLPIPVLEVLMAGGYVVEKSARVSVGIGTVPALGLADSLLSPDVVAYRARLATLFPTPEPRL